MISPQLKSKLAKVYELVKRGATEGERAAAQIALEKLIEKHNLSDIKLDALDKNECRFKYSTALDQRLFLLLLAKMLPDNIERPALDTWHKREIAIQLTYLDYVTMTASYEYFKKHMAKQWKAVCAGEVKRKRKAKTKNARRSQLQTYFFERYIIESNLIDERYLIAADTSTMTSDELMMMDIEGGKYHIQVQTGHLLGN